MVEAYEGLCVLNLNENETDLLVMMYKDICSVEQSELIDIGYMDLIVMSDALRVFCQFGKSRNNYHEYMSKVEKTIN